MRKVCADVHCKNIKVKGDGQIFHRFPVDNPELCKKWEGATRRVFTPTKNHFLCPLHFKEDDYTIIDDESNNSTCRQLKEDAVPSVFSFTTLGSEDTEGKSLKKRNSKPKINQPSRKARSSSTPVLLKVTKNKEVETVNNLQAVGDVAKNSPKSTHITKNGPPSRYAGVAKRNARATPKKPGFKNSQLLRNSTSNNDGSFTVSVTSTDTTSASRRTSSIDHHQLFEKIYSEVSNTPAADHLLAILQSLNNISGKSKENLNKWRKLKNYVSSEITVASLHHESEQTTMIDPVSKSDYPSTLDKHTQTDLLVAGLVLVSDHSDKSGPEDLTPNVSAKPGLTDTVSDRIKRYMGTDIIDPYHELNGAICKTFCGESSESGPGEKSEAQNDDEEVTKSLLIDKDGQTDLKSEKSTDSFETISVAESNTEMTVSLDDSDKDEVPKLFPAEISENTTSMFPSNYGSLAPDPFNKYVQEWPPSSTSTQIPVPIIDEEGSAPPVAKKSDSSNSSVESCLVTVESSVIWKHVLPVENSLPSVTEQSDNTVEDKSSNESLVFYDTVTSVPDDPKSASDPPFSPIIPLIVLTSPGSETSSWDDISSPVVEEPTSVVISQISEENIRIENDNTLLSPENSSSLELSPSKEEWHRELLHTPHSNGGRPVSAPVILVSSITEEDEENENEVSKPANEIPLQLPAPPPGAPPPPPPPPPPPKDFLEVPDIDDSPPMMRRSASLPANYAPQSKMKKLQWKKIPKHMLNRSNSCIWKKVTEMPTSSLDASTGDKIEELFGNADLVIKKEEKKEKVGAAPKGISLLTVKTSINVNIFLHQFKGGGDEIVEFIVKGVPNSALDADRLRCLEKLIPDENETKELKAFTGDVKELGTAEKFFLRLMGVPNYQLRITIMILKEDFETSMEKLKPSIATFRKAIEDLLNNEILPEILNMILSVGNFMNHGSHAGNAYAFKITSLLKLTDTRASNNTKITLLHYIVQMAEEKQLRLLEFPDMLPKLSDACLLNVDHLDNEVQKLKRNLEATVKRFNKSSEGLKTELGAFFNSSITECVGLESSIKEIRRLSKVLAEYLCEDPKRFVIEDNLKMFQNFCKALTKAREENEHVKKLEARKALMKQRRWSRSESMKEKFV